MTDDGIVKFHNEMFSELPIEIADKAVRHIVSLLSEDSKEEIRLAHEIDRETWWATAHFGWGMAIRNSLRDNVCLDDKLPSGNWDDYYVKIVEMACGIL